MTKPMNINFDELGIEVEHHFSTKICAKKTIIPAGCDLAQHEHLYDHLSVVAAGRAILFSDNGSQIELNAGDCVNVPAGRRHAVRAVTDVVWFCINYNPFDETDPDKLDQELVR